ncbi:hypothetical protein [Candidatus Nitrosocosmicus hydrocola]|uniref:hypothetical protein n=1 Tax=Candidatus Nitrosocosmicus hydrocola TaxID=1826872 RepID=UPI0011E5B4F1|nr:hypothetical protein [Candidatus Nitrosocosmicus hydrocola]
MSSGDIPESTRIAPNDEAYIDYGKRKLTDQIDVIKDFIKLMIPLTTALITSYLALLKFTTIQITSSNEFNMIYSPIIVLISLIVFIIAIFPIPFPINISNLESIKKQLIFSTIYKYVGAILGCIIFLVGFSMMIGVIIGR